MRYSLYYFYSKYYHKVYCFLANKFSDIDTFYIPLLYNENKLCLYLITIYEKSSS